MKKSRLFVASSGEHLDFAYAAQECLDKDAEVTVWTQGIFDLGGYNLEALIAELDRCDYGLFIFAPDDITRMRDKELQTVRDNVIFELGLFIGRLGRDRSFILIPRGLENFHLPTDLLGVGLAEFDAGRSDKNWGAALGPACHRIRLKLRQGKPKPGITYPQGITIVPRSVFGEILLQRLEDENTHTVQIVTYTGEVDAGMFNKFRIKGSKNIEFFKRSILSDLAEQQEVNLQRIAARSTVKKWYKREISWEASEGLERRVPPVSTFTQYLYYGPPTKRIYYFNQEEAVIAFYEVVDRPLKEGGSVYKGMVKTPGLRVTRESPLGDLILDEVEHFLGGLRRASRRWEEEVEILRGGSWRGGGRSPCVEPKVVFLDLDGVLYDSLPHYVKAWQEAFKEAGVELSEEMVYREEGRRGEDTIVNYFHNKGINVEKNLVEKIQNRKKAILKELGNPKVQKGAVELVRSIANSNLPMWVVTGSSNREYLKHLDKDFEGNLNEERLITGRDVRVGKPDPDPYLFACHNANVHPHEAIVVENAPLGVESAETAGTFCIAVNTGILSDEELMRAGARAVFKSCSALSQSWDEIVTMLKK